MRFYYPCVLGKPSTFHAPSGQVVTVSNQRAVELPGHSRPSNAEPTPALATSRSQQQPTGVPHIELNKTGNEESDDGELMIDCPDTEDLAYALGLKGLPTQSNGVKPQSRDVEVGDSSRLTVTSVIDACTVKGSLLMEDGIEYHELFRLDGLTMAQEAQADRGGVILLERLTVGKQLTATVTGKATDGPFLVKIEDVQSQKSINDIVGGSRFVCRTDSQLQRPVLPRQVGLFPQPVVDQPSSHRVVQPAPVALIPTPSPRNRCFENQVERFKFPHGRMFHVVISEIVNPTMFIQVAEGDSGARMCELSTQLTDHCMHSAIPMSWIPERNEIVCARYDVDKCWYRARVNRIVDGTSLEVAFMDYGNRAVVLLDEVRGMSSEFLQLPVQAQQCLLTDFKGTVPGGKYSDRAVDFLKSLKSVMVECVPGSSNPNVQFIRLFDVSNPQMPVPIGERMVELGLAYRLKPRSEPSAPQPVGFGRGLQTFNMNTSRPGAMESQRSGPLSAPARPPLPRAQSPGLATYPTAPGEKFYIIVTHIASPTLFWAQLADRSYIESLCELMEKMAVDCNASRHAPGFQPKIGELCCARYTGDSNWYRATVNSVSGQAVNVKFVDFGNDEILNVSAIRPISADYLQLPLQALKFGLYGVAGMQLRDVTGRFRELCLNKKLEVTVREQSQTSLSVDLNDTSVTPHLSVISELQKGVTVARPVTDIAPSVRQPIDPLSLPSVDAEQQCVMADSIDQVCPPDTQTFDIVITTFESPDCFYGQLADSAAMKRFIEFSNKLNEHYTQHSLQPLSPNVAELCCAFFVDDMSFYRAHIESVVSPAEVVVKYVDYGNASTVNSSSIYRLETQFLSLPKQAVALKLAGISAPSRGWSQEAVKLCHGIVVNQKKTCKRSKQILGKVEVELFDNPSCDTPSLNQQLVDRRLAVYSTPERRRLDQPVASVESPSVQHPPTKKSISFQLDGFTQSKLPSTEQFSAIGTVVEGADSFYIQVVDPPVIRELADLMQSMSDHYSGIRQRPFIPVAGTVYAGRFSEDGRWYRAHMVAVDYEKRTASVSYPDFGNKETVPFTSLAPLVDAFKELPLQAVHCRLAGVEALGTQATDFVTVRVVDKQVLVHRDPQSVGEDPYPVDIVDPASGVFLSSLLVEKRMAKSTVGLTVKPDEKKVERYYLSEVGQAIIPADGFFTCLITIIDNPGCFWGQVVSRDTAVQLQQLSVDVTEHCQNQVEEGSTFHPEKDELCCAQFSVDGLWYRAAVETVEEDDTFTVRFVDFGNAERVSADKVSPIPRSFLSLPRIAVQCQLAGIKPKSSIIWPSNATHGFRLLVEGRELMAKQINVYGSVFSVELYDTSTEVDVFINKELVVAGLADPLAPVSGARS